MRITEYKSIIKSLNPLEDSKFTYVSERWSKLNPKLKASVLDFENRSISRGQVIEKFKQYFYNQIGLEAPFTLSMIWGFANNGYGAYRTNSYYNGHHIEHLELGFSHLSKFNIRDAYQEFQKIKGISISYISKLLYFATRAISDDNYYLIYDSRVAQSLIKLTCPKEIYEIVDVKPSKKFVHYEIYNSYIHRVARENELEADSIEMFLFLQKI